MQYPSPRQPPPRVARHRPHRHRRRGQRRHHRRQRRRHRQQGRDHGPVPQHERDRPSRDRHGRRPVAHAAPTCSPPTNDHGVGCSDGDDVTSRTSAAPSSTSTDRRSPRPTTARPDEGRPAGTSVRQGCTSRRHRDQHHGDLVVDGRFRRTTATICARSTAPRRTRIDDLQRHEPTADGDVVPVSTARPSASWSTPYVPRRRRRVDRRTNSSPSRFGGAGCSRAAQGLPPDLPRTTAAPGPLGPGAY